MTTQHTPGPWAVDDTGYRAPGNGLCVMAWPECVAVVDANNPHLPQDANARLIAAAPDLLEALKDALATIEDYLGYEHNGDPWTEDARSMGEMDVNDYKRDGRLARARAAITKATGEI